MPQLDPSTYPSQLFWLLITFVLLYVVVVKVALPRIGTVLEARQDKIDDDLKKAAARKEEAEAVLAEYEASMASAKAKAMEALQVAKDEMAAETEKAFRRAERSVGRADQGAAEARISSAKADALKNLEGPVAEVVASATSKLIGTPHRMGIRSSRP